MIESWRPLVDAELERHIVAIREECPRLGPACEYMVLGKGKRLRPLLTLAVYRDLTGMEPSLPDVAVSCATELLHVASLIHDDLPALDNDDERRGRPSCHKAFGESTAILAGDLLVGAAFRACAGSGNNSALLARAWMALCEGQQVDTEGVAAGEGTTMYRLKTGALFGCCCSLGCGLAGRPHLADGAWNLGKEIGVGFQMVDDLLELMGENSLKGRCTSSDERNQKRTVFSTMAFEELPTLTRSCVALLCDMKVSFQREAGRPLLCTSHLVDRITEQLEGYAARFCRATSTAR